MQTARCLCNLPSQISPKKKDKLTATTVSQSNLLNQIWPGLNSRGSLHDPKTLAAFVWANIWTAQWSWPSSLAFLAGVGVQELFPAVFILQKWVGFIGMLWKTRIYPDVLFSMNCSESDACVCARACLGSAHAFLMGSLHPETLISKLGPAVKFKIVCCLYIVFLNRGNVSSQSL